MTKILRPFVVYIACTLLGAVPAIAQELTAPSGEVVLTVTGAIGVTNQGDAAVFDLEMLKAIGEVSFTTTTPWTEGDQIFTGVPLEALMKTIGVTEGTLTAKAINDYAVEIPVSDAVADGPIIAYQQNGKAMSVRENGPLWVIYPFDLNDAYQSEVIYSRSIWQLTHIDVKTE